MPASRGVDPLATSHTIEHLSNTFGHNWSHAKSTLYIISHCLNKTDIALFESPDNKQFFF